MESSLKWPDYLVLVSFLVISLAIGLSHSLTGGRQKTTEEFIMANRQLKVLPTAISLLVSFLTAILVLGFTAEMYSYGPQFVFFQPCASIIGFIIVERLFVPWLYRQKLVSINEFCLVRFDSNAVKLLASTLAILSSILYMGIAMYAPSASLESVTGLRLWVSIPSMSLICIAYTSLGGMKAVIWTDVFQFLTMFVGMLAIIIQGIIEVGGLDNVMRHLRDEGRMDFVDWSPDPTVRLTFWNFMFGASVTLTQLYGINQASIQRFSATKSLTKARQTVMLSLLGTLLLCSISGFIGFIVVAYYAKVRCDPLANKEITSVNELVPHFVMTVFHHAPGFAGLFLATLYGASLSSVSSSLSGSAANCWEDILKGKLSHLHETTKAIINRILVIVFGLLATMVAFLAAILPGPVTQIGITFLGSVAGPYLGIFMLGGLSRIPNWKGALTGGIAGIAVNMWISIGSMTVSNKYPPLPPLSIDRCSQNETSMSFIRSFANSSTLGSLSTTAAFEAVTNVFPNSSNVGIRIEHHGIEKFYCLSYMWYALLGFLVTLFVGFIVSLISRDKDAEKAVEEKCLIKFGDVFTLWSNDKVEEEENKLNKDAQVDLLLERCTDKTASSKESHQIIRNEIACNQIAWEKTDCDIMS